LRPCTSSSSSWTVAGLLLLLARLLLQLLLLPLLRLLPRLLPLLLPLLLLLLLLLLLVVLPPPRPTAPTQRCSSARARAAPPLLRCAAIHNTAVPQQLPRGAAALEWHGPWSLALGDGL
jgi:hypothetical protein